MEVAKTVFSPLSPYLNIAKLEINTRCQNLEPWQVVAYSVGTTLATVYVYNLLFQPHDTLSNRVKKSLFRLLKKLPFISGKVTEELEKTKQSLENKFHASAKGHSYITHLPVKGKNEEEVLKDLEKYKSLVKVPWLDGACSGTVYSGDAKLTELMAKVYGAFAWTNPLHADVFPDIRKMEAEVVRMTCNLFHGGPDSCGTMTTGGTESIMLACKAYRDMAIERGVQYPEMIVPVTAHAAFDKAAHFFRIRIIHIPVDPETRQVKYNEVWKAINSRTCMIAVSAPQFPHGVLDPIEKVSQLAKRYAIPCHVDSCLGGFLVPFMEKAGYPLPPFDFRCEGVTSISADTHKYGYAPKGSSVIMYSHNKYRKYQYFVQPDWPGGIYATPTFTGSRAGAIIAACWATLMVMGEEGYVEATRKIISTTKYIEKELSKIDGIFIYGKPQVSVVGFGSKQFNVYRVSDAMSAKGWNLNALQFPSGVHLCVTLVHTKPGVAERFVKDVKEVVAEVMKDPDADCGGQGALYGMAQTIPDRSIVSEIAGTFFDAYYSTTVKAKTAQNGVKQ